MLHPQIEHERRQVDNGLVHYITRETGQQCEDTGEAFENTCLPDTRLKALLLVLGVRLGGDNAYQVLLIFEWVDWREVVDVDIQMVAGCFMCT